MQAWVLSTQNCQFKIKIPPTAFSEQTAKYNVHHYFCLYDTILLSIGGLLCRAMIETVAGHNVHNFVSLSAPMMGQFGRKLHDTCYIVLIIISLCIYSLRLHTDCLPQLHCRSLVLVCIHCIMHTAVMSYAVG